MQNVSQNITIILGASALLLLITLFIVLILMAYQKKENKYSTEKKLMHEEFQKQLLHSQIEVQESTFFALGQELHDNVGQLLSSTKMLLGLTQRKLGNVPDTLTIAEETLGKAISEIRSLSKSLDKEWLEQFDLLHNLTTEINRINTAKHIEIHFSHPDKIFLGSEKQIILFRIVQEAIQNIIKHSNAKNAEINFINSPSLLTVIIADDGKGFNGVQSIDGLGMKNMKHRAQLLGGTINWETAPLVGSTITINLPINNAE